MDNVRFARRERWWRRIGGGGFSDLGRTMQGFMEAGLVSTGWDVVGTCYDIGWYDYIATLRAQGF
jgi:hypothetical protein